MPIASKAFKTFLGVRQTTLKSLGASKLPERWLQVAREKPEEIS